MMNYSDFSNPKDGYTNPKSNYLAASPTYATQVNPSQSTADLGFFKKIIKDQLSKIKADTSIDERISIVRALYSQVKQYFVLNLSFEPFHPAVLLFEFFLQNKQAIVMKITDNEESASDLNDKIFADIRKLPELNFLAYINTKDWKIGKSIPIHRKLRTEGESSFLSSFLSDVIHNPSRALLGSCSGTVVKESEDENSITYKINVVNPLNWESATRFPPSLGGYQGESLVPKIPGWSIDMDFTVTRVIQKANFFKQ